MSAEKLFLVLGIVNPKWDYNRALGSLPSLYGDAKRLEKIIRLRFGLYDGDQPKTLREVGDIYGKSPETIRRWEARGLRMLKHPVRQAMIVE